MATTPTIPDLGAIVENEHGTRFEVVAVQAPSDVLAGTVSLASPDGDGATILLDAFAAHFSPVEELTRKRGRPRLTEGQRPERVEVLMPRALARSIPGDRSAFIRAAIAEKLDRESAEVTP